MCYVSNNFFYVDFIVLRLHLYAIVLWLQQILTQVSPKKNVNPLKTNINLS